MTTVLLRELRDLPLNLIREHWHSLTKRELPMITIHKKPQWTFYPSWIVLTTLSIPVALLIARIILTQAVQVIGDNVFINDGRRMTADWLFGYTLLTALGLTRSIFQYFLLRRYLPQAGWWLGATTLGWFLVVPTVSFLNIFLPKNLETNANLFIFLMIILGGLVGSLQWLVLRRYVRRTGWWILATIAGWMAVWLVRENLTSPLDMMLLTILPAFVTAPVFVWLMNQTQPTELREA
ncbi:MAG: hypothetical protein GY805_10750 [Chloroflexi bacterium]|nr:hypothetical protein [Chloroflexota bacterium]